MPRAKVREVAYSFSDQALAVGGMFLANVVLARTQSREEYGVFALCYSIYLFVAGLHSAAVVDPYTVHGAGRYRDASAGYFRLMATANVLAGAASAALLLGACGVLRAFAPGGMPKALLGMALAITFLLSGIFLRRACYVQGKASEAAKASLVFFVVVVAGVWLAKATGRLDGFTVFMILALGWSAALLRAVGQFARLQEEQVATIASYWHEHWGYARWALATAFLAQLVLQGYYWLIAGLLTVSNVADLRVLTLLIAPAEQVFIALNYVVLPRFAALHAGGRAKELVGLWRRYVIAIVAVTAGFVFGVRVAGLPVLHIVFQGKFDALFPLLKVLAFLPLLMGVGHTMNAALKAMERPKLIFYGYAGSGIAGLLAGVPLVARFGLRGAVYGMLLSGAVYTGVLAASFWWTVGHNQEKETTREELSGEKWEPVAVTTKGVANGVYHDPNLAPIALFVYQRLEHTRRTVESLGANDLAALSDLYVFSDGARNVQGESKVARVREYLRTIRGFRSVNIVEQNGNAGLGKSVIEGVTRLCKERGRLIVMEDDLLTTPDFLTFMNQALARYEREPGVFSVSGFNFALRAPEGYPSDAFCFYRSSSLGWGTWRDRWEKADWTVADYAEFCRDKKQQKKFNRGGEDLSGMLALQMDGWIDSWAIRWAYEHCRHDALALHSLRSRVFHIGADGTGTHTRRGALRQSALTTEHKAIFLLPDHLEPEPEFVERLQRSLRASRARRLARYALRKWQGRKRGRVLPEACMPSKSPAKSNVSEVFR
ncbi:MAG TPA: hypothetical protein VN982_07490 [Candidatus Dormibacteraeota bacterium]|nr:hypothetical protein [Candidatus Dormibacteraeota bacterium]